MPELVNAPEVPVMVTVEVPCGVVDDVVTLIVDVPEPATDVGLKLALAPLGNPVAVNATLPLKPF